MCNNLHKSAALHEECDSVSLQLQHVLHQAVVSASTIALREAEIEQAAAVAAAVDSLTILSGCNRSVEMEYVFVVSLPCAYSFWASAAELAQYKLASPRHFQLKRFQP